MKIEKNHSVCSTEQLHQFVHDTLCASENLLKDQFQTMATPLSSGGRPCGIQFNLHGPRSVRLGAIWAMGSNEVFFYDARGERFLKVKLCKRFEPQSRAAG